MSEERDGFAPIADKMRREGLPEIVIRNFKHYYRLVQSGETGLIPESNIRPVDALPDADAFAGDPALMAAGQAAMGRAVAIKLNGGLGTSMGLDRAKSLLTVKNDHTFLDIIARQAIKLGAPLIFMNSFSTREDTLAALARYPELQREDIPLDFVQNKVPKLTQADLTPVSWPPNPALKWCPPGHGDIYAALITSGMLNALLDAGYRYAFVSNADNLGAVMDAAILGYFAANELSFMMEAADRTESDRKGGHLARRPDGQLILRESAQCPDEDKGAFEDINRHRYFNTNNLWINLPALKRLMTEKNNVLGLPMIRNSKTVDPRDPASTPVYQLETAMGSAIGVFPGSGAVRVSRSRFAPIKTTNDLLAVRSDAYVLTDDYRVVLDPSRERPPFIQLDSAYYKLIDAMEARFPKGAPSLIRCRSLAVEGDIRFGRDVVMEGDVHLVNETGDPLVVEDSSRLVGVHS